MIGATTFFALAFGVPVLLPLALGLPLLLLLACAFAPLRRRLPRLFVVAPLPALAAALTAGSEPPLVLGNSVFALRFDFDTPGAVLLLVAAILWIFGGAYAARWLRDQSERDGFIVCWLMTLSGCIGLFLAADLISFYLMLALLSVGASGLVLQGRGPDAFFASALYLGLALAAEALLLVGLLLLAQATPDGSLLIRDAAAALPNSPWRDITLLFLIMGLGIKAGLVPMHFWMPMAYGAAPIPAAAVMSGAVVKASILGLIRFLPFDLALPAFGLPLAAVGLFGALYGVAIGLRQSQGKRILAYSSVSQMGFLVALLGMGLAAGASGVALAASFYAAHHLLVKGALFLALGVAMRSGRRQLWWVLLPAAVIALGLGGLPLTGGALAKYAAKDFMGSGWASNVALLSSIATTLLMCHFLRRTWQDAARDVDARAPAILMACWLALALASVALPWSLSLALPLDLLPQAVAPAALWAALWPVLIGIVLALGLARLGHSRHLMDADAGATAAGWPRLAAGLARAGAGVESLDGLARRWSVASIAMLVVCLLFGYLLMASA